jgi:hypothetical protein
MVYLNLAKDLPVDAGQVMEKMKKLGVLVDADNTRRFRLVTHYWIDDEAVQKTVAAFERSIN